MMEKIIQVINETLSFTTEQQIFIIAVLSISVAGFALYVVLTAIKNDANKRDPS